MQIRSIVLLVAALSIALGTALYAKRWMAAERAGMETAAKAETVEKKEVRILVAAKALSAGTFVKPDNFRWQVWPEEGVLESYAVEGKMKISDFAGAVVRSEIAAGQPIMGQSLVQPGDRGFLAAVLTAGNRAVSVPVNATSGISGFVFPGDMVDILFTMKMRSEESENGPGRTRHISETLLSGIRVLAVDQTTENLQGTAKISKTVTLEATPKQVEKITIALSMGELSLSLRSLAQAAEKDLTQDQESYTIDNDVLFIHKAFYSGANNSKTRSLQVDVVRGNTADTVSFN